MNQNQFTSFDPHVFQKVLQRYLLWALVPLFLALIPLQGLLFLPDGTPSVTVAGLPLLDVSRSGEIAMGWLAMGGFAIGIIAVGGCSVGLVAIGGGAIGLFAIGGGAIGLVAIGGGAAGYIAIGGGGFGKYVLGGDGKGRHVLTYKRQDRQAAEFFCGYLVGLRKAFPRGIEALEDP